MKKFSVVLLITLLMAFTFVSCNSEPAQAAGPVETAKATKMLSAAKEAMDDKETAGGTVTVTGDENGGKITYDGCTIDGETFSGVYEMNIEGTVAKVHVDLKFGKDSLRFDSTGGFTEGKFSFEATATITVDGKDYTLDAKNLIFFQVSIPSGKE